MSLNYRKNISFISSNGTFSLVLWTVHLSFSKGFRCMATKPLWSLHDHHELLWSSVFSLPWTCTLGRPLGRIKVSVCSAGQAQKWQWGFDAWGGGPVSDTECQRSSGLRHIALTLWAGKRHSFPQTTSLSHPQQPHAHHCLNCVWFSPLYLVNQLQLMLMSGSLL